METRSQPDIPDPEIDRVFMGEALRQAAKAYEAQEVPVGVVIVRGHRVIARAWNQVELLKDATAHAEMLALTMAQEAVGDWRLTDCTLYVTKEPCPMCAGAIVHCRLARVVFGAPDAKGGAAGGVQLRRGSARRNAVTFSRDSSSNNATGRIARQIPRIHEAGARVYATERIC